MNFDEALQFLKSKAPLRITIGGDIGSGKSTFAQHLAAALEVPRVYAGQIFCEQARERGLSVEEFGKLSEQDDSIDRELDAMMSEKSKEIERGIFEGRVSWHFVESPDCKVFIAVEPHVGAERAFGDRDNPKRDKYASVAEVMAAHAKRKQSERTRYQKYYNIDSYDQVNYDVVIDTTKLNIDQVFEAGVIAIAKYLTKNQD